MKPTFFKKRRNKLNMALLILNQSFFNHESTMPNNNDFIFFIRFSQFMYVFFKKDTAQSFFKPKRNTGPKKNLSECPVLFNLKWGMPPENQ